MFLDIDVPENLQYVCKITGKVLLFVISYFHFPYTYFLEELLMATEH